MFFLLVKFISSLEIFSVIFQISEKLHRNYIKRGIYVYTSLCLCYAVMLVVEIACNRGWGRVQFEMDSDIVLENFLQLKFKNYRPPWTIRSWDNCPETPLIWILDHHIILGEGYFGIFIFLIESKSRLIVFNCIYTDRIQ